MIQSFAELLAPFDEQTFRRVYLHQKPLHIRGSAGRFAAAMSWDLLNGLLNQSSIWSPVNFQLAADGPRLPPDAYCDVQPGPGGAPQHRVNLDKARTLMRDGATLVLNDIDLLTPGLRQLAALLQAATGTKSQANLYCSWQQKPGFGSHFDTHDVYALHVSGTKTWTIYGKAFDDPIAHPRFKALGNDFHRANRGQISQTVHMQPGDLLYIPRGWYHDALATSPGTIHIAFGLTAPIGLDVLRLLSERAVDDALFRADLVGQDGQVDQAWLADHLQQLAGSLNQILSDRAFVEEVRERAASFGYLRPEITLPGDITNAASAVTAHLSATTGAETPENRPTSPIKGFRRGVDFRVRNIGGKWCVVVGKQAMPIPPGAERAVEWVAAREHVDADGLAAAISGLSPSAARDLLQALAGMDLLRVD
jgi:ribosomal protein L16 Arg81 hydroxylase